MLPTTTSYITIHTTLALLLFQTRNEYCIRVSSHFSRSSKSKIGPEEDLSTTCESDQNILLTIRCFLWLNNSTHYCLYYTY